tara:strand:- start:1668 stop:2054 length:387 start_codon:yes stop_codon:yes gene_type:complete
MPQNYTFTAQTSVSATSTSGFSATQQGNFTLNLTGIDQVQTGRLDIGTGNTVVMAAPTYGKAVYIRNLDDTNFIEIHSAAVVDTDVIGILEPGEWMFFVLRDTQAVGASADTAACTIEYFAVEIDSAA